MSTNEELCWSLMRADTDKEVVEILCDAGYWHEQNLWRYLDDNENNFGAIGNQQSSAVAALIEKLVNSVDARLLNSCLERGIDPTSSDAPRSIREAVARFFEEWDDEVPDDAGRIYLWTDAMASREADKLTLSATGYGPKSGSGLPSLSIADAGEGQTPDEFPDTFLSLQRSNKLKVPFVQGKFNMGATGALQFSSPENRLQLIVSRRNPAFVNDPGSRDGEWGFTVVRREPAAQGARSSVYTYLAPLSVNSGRDGRVLSFRAERWPIFPRVDREQRDPYCRESSFGSLVKLYEYQLDGTKSNIVRSSGGLLQRVDFGLAELALPIRLYECRDSYRGHSGSFSTNVLGVVARLTRDRSEKLEAGFPVNHVVRLEQREVSIRVYALKGNAKEYRAGTNAVAFTINGQTHAVRGQDFFRRKAVGMSQLAESLMVVVDCTNIDGQLREDMFMNSRDRLRQTPASSRLERELEKFLHDDPQLRDLRHRRRAEEIEAKFSESRPLAEALATLVKTNPSLSRLLRGGPNVPSPFRKGGASTGYGSASFRGKRFPTYFRFRKLADGESLERVAHLDSQVRLRFETDAQDDYFHRERDRGAFEVDVLDQTVEIWEPLANLSLTGPQAGLASLSFDLPDGVRVGETVRVRILVTDPARVDAFELEARLRVMGPANRSQGGRGGDQNRNSGGGQGGDESNVALPRVVPVHRDEWEKHGFDELSALKVVGQGITDDGLEEYDFYVNLDNKHLLLGQKDPRRDPDVVRAQFVNSLVLFSMALLVEEKPRGDSSGDSSTPPKGDDDVETMVATVARRLAPFVLPTLDAMSASMEQVL